jgi:RecB family exonuclease
MSISANAVFAPDTTGAKAPESLKLSATRVKMYLTCPRQFRYKYVEEIPGDLTGALAFGQVIHQVLRNIGQWSLSHGEPLNESVALYEFSRLWEEIVYRESPRFKDDEEMVSYSALAKLILIGFIEAHREKPLPILLEYPFEIPLKDEGSGREYLIRGIIDRVDQVEDGLVIVDYKTGKRKPSQKQLSEDVQLTIYALAAQRLFKQQVKQVVYYHLRDQTTFPVLLEEERLQTLLLETLPQVACGIEERRFAPCSGYWCRFCDYRELCREEGDVDLSRYEPRSVNGS